MVSLRVKTLSSTNKVDSRHKNASHSVDRRFSKTTLMYDSAMLPENVDCSPRLNFINFLKNEKVFFFYGFLWLVDQEIKMSTSYNFELRCGASYIIKQRVSFVTVLTTRSDAVEV